MAKTIEVEIHDEHGTTTFMVDPTEHLRIERDEDGHYVIHGTGRKITWPSREPHELPEIVHIKDKKNWGFS